MAINGKKVWRSRPIKGSFTKGEKMLNDEEFARNARKYEELGERSYWMKKRMAADAVRDEVEKPRIEKMIAETKESIRKEFRKQQDEVESEIADDSIFDVMFKGKSPSELNPKERVLMNSLQQRKNETKDYKIKMELLRMKRTALEDEEKENRDNAIGMLEQQVKTSDMSLPEYKRRLSKVYEDYDRTVKNIRKSTIEDVFNENKSAK